MYVGYLPYCSITHFVTFCRYRLIGWYNTRMSGPEMSADVHVVDLARKRMAVLGNVLVLGILCPFLSVMVVGEMVLQTHKTKYGEASLDGGGGHDH